jgi:signal transduction histidine kinase
MEHHGTVLVVKDMTQIRKSEQEREKIKLQLFAQSKLALLGEVAAGVAHEINNPLTFIKAYLAILEEDRGEQRGGSKRAESLLPEAARQVERIRKIVRHMQRVRQDDSSGRSRGILTEILDNSMVLIQERISANGIMVRREIAENLPGVLCSPDALEQLMTNLWQNAIDSLEEVDRERNIVIRMDVGHDNETVVLDFCDNGTGISEADRDRIFEPFFTTKEVGKGTGLGLSLSYAIAQDHQGDLICLSESGQGATMRLVLPINPKNAA